MDATDSVRDASAHEPAMRSGIGRESRRGSSTPSSRSLASIRRRCWYSLSCASLPHRMTASASRTSVSSPTCRDRRPYSRVSQARYGIGASVSTIFALTTVVSAPANTSIPRTRPLVTVEYG